MAIIKCPECGETLSSAAKRCVHCGAVFTVCPECGSSFVGNVSLCSKCGFEIHREDTEKKEVKRMESAEASKSIVTVVNQWMSESPIRQLLWNPSKIIALLFDFVYIIPLAFAVLKLYNWDDIMSTDAVRETVIVLVAFSFAFVCVKALRNVYKEYYAYAGFSSWIKKENIGLLSIVENDFSQDMTKLVTEELELNKPFWRMSVVALYYNEHTTRKMKDQTFAWLYCAVKIISALFLMFFLLDNLDVYMAGKFTWGSEFKFEIKKIESWWKLIACVAISIGGIFIGSDNEIDALNWLEKNYPKLGKVYSKYVF